MSIVRGMFQNVGRSTDPSAVSDGQAVTDLADTLGKQVMLQGAVHALHVDGKGNFTTATAADIIAAQGAGVKIVAQAIIVVNSHATVGTKVEIRDGTTVKISQYAAPAGGGFVLTAGGAPIVVSSANTALTARCATSGADVDVFISGYVISN